MLLHCCLLNLMIITTLPCLTSTEIVGEDTMRIKDYSKSRTIILLLNGEESTIECADHGGPESTGLPFFDRQVAWHFGDTRSLRRIQFDADGRFESPTDSSEFRLVDSTGYAIAVRASGSVGGEAKESSVGLLSIRNSTPESSEEARTVGPNGILACSSPSSSSSNNAEAGGSWEPQRPRAVFHLMVVTAAIASGGGGGGPSCPLPGYRLGSYAGRPACHPCLPGEFASFDRSRHRRPICLPCQPGFESHGFASSGCGQAAKLALPPPLRRVRRSQAGAPARLLIRRLPLASFTGIVMYHFLLVLSLSVVLCLCLLMAACSFDTVWCGVLSDTETSIATVLEDRFVLPQPDPDDHVPDSD